MTSIANRLITFATACALVAGSCCDVYAQTPSAPPVNARRVLPAPYADRNWPAGFRSGSRQEMYLSTVAQPGKRRHCHNPAFTPESVSCAQGGGKPKVYRMEDVQTLTLPGMHTRWWLCFAGFVGAGAGTITGAVFLASVTIIGAVPVAAVGGLILLISPLTAMIADDDRPDTVIYEKPKQDVAIDLH